MYFPIVLGNIETYCKLLFIPLDLLPYNQVQLTVLQLPWVSSWYRIWGQHHVKHSQWDRDNFKNPAQSIFYSHHHYKKCCSLPFIFVLLYNYPFMCFKQQSDIHSLCTHSDTYSYFQKKQIFMFLIQQMLNFVNMTRGIAVGTTHRMGKNKTKPLYLVGI